MQRQNSGWCEIIDDIRFGVCCLSLRKCGLETGLSIWGCTVDDVSGCAT